MAPDAKHVFDRLLTDTLAPDLKAAGFRKSGRKFYRRLGSIIQLIHFDGAWCSSREELMFHVDLAIWSDRVASLEPFRETSPGTRKGLPRSGVPVPYLCHWRARIAEIAPGTRTTRWICKANASNTQLRTNLRNAILDHALPCFDGLTNDGAILNSVQCERYPHAIQPPLYIAAFYRVARPLPEFDRYARRIMADSECDESVERLWRTALARIRKTTPRPQQPQCPKSPTDITELMRDGRAIDAAVKRAVRKPLKRAKR